MPRFEVFCPAAPPALPADVRLELEAESWLAALEAGIARTRGARRAAHILCDVQADGAIHVAEPQGGGVFRIRELQDVAPALAAVAAAPAAVVRTASAPPSAAGLPAGHTPAIAPHASPDRDAGLARILDLALQEVDAEAGSVLLTRPGGRELEFVVVRGPRARALTALRPVVPVGVGIVGYCVREGAALAVSDVQRDPRFLRDLSRAIDYPTRSILCAPIVRDGQVLGALEVLNRRGGAPFGARDVAAVSRLAGQAAEHLARTG